MAKTKKTPAIKTKKSLKKEVAASLTEIFTDIKSAVGEKKFSKKIKKASKIIAAGALKVKTKKEVENKKKVASKKKAVSASDKAVKVKESKSKKPAKAAKVNAAPASTEATTS